MKTLEEIKNTIIQGDCLEKLKEFPDESVDCVITSPPYWALRDYGVEGQLGLEPTFQEYITKLCDIFDEVKRVLKKEGTCWVNIGDTYGGSGAGTWQNKPADAKSKEIYTLPYGKSSCSKMRGTPQDKCLLQIPSRFAIEMTNRGWILRNEIIWYKPNCMPSSADDRFTVDFEKVFFFVKNKKYWFEQQLDEYSVNSDMAYRKTLRCGRKYGVKRPYQDNQPLSYNNTPLNTEGKNKRCIWKVETHPFAEAHFATFPEKLIMPMIKAGCPEKGIVLDPFMGAGTTAKVAKDFNRNYIGIELNPEYIEIANKRLRQEVMDF
jgi:site-specific DNA-methyltransferase (adenine-specific)